MNRRHSKKIINLKALDQMIGEITADAHDDDEKLQTFRQAFMDNVELPVDGFVIGVPVSVIQVDYDGNERRGLTARCRCEEGSEYDISICDVLFPQASVGERYVAAYRKWIELDPFPAEIQPSSRPQRQHKVSADELDLSKPIEFVVLSVKERTARCRLLDSDRVITVRASDLWKIAPGQIITVHPHKQWRYAGHPYLSGEIQSARIDVAALGLVPLGLAEGNIWNPQEHYWGEDEPVEEWAKPIIAHGVRPTFEMEQVLPGDDPDNPFLDPITRSNDLIDAGEKAEAIKILMALCQADLRCLDAHSHLGNLVFTYSPKDAVRHYEIGFRIGELSLGNNFNGLLPWDHINNRPFMRCMHGYGLCLWRLGHFDEAGRIFNRMLWLNPSDNQGVRFLIDEVKARTTWEDSENR